MDEADAHQHPRVDFPAVALTRLAKPVEKRIAVVVGDKNRLAAVAAGHHMIQRAGILEPSLPSHARKWKTKGAKARRM